MFREIAEKVRGAAHVSPMYLSEKKRNCTRMQNANENAKEKERERERDKYPLELLIPGSAMAIRRYHLKSERSSDCHAFVSAGPTVEYSNHRSFTSLVTHFWRSVTDPTSRFDVRR